MSIFLSFRALVAASAASLLLVAAGSISAQTFKFAATAGESPTELQRRDAPLVNKQVGMAGFGGFTFVQANVRSGGKVLPMVQREEVEKFRSVFINTEASINSLADLKGKSMSFGLQSSTLSHLVPLGAALDC